MSGIALTCTVDASRLNRGIEAAIKMSKREARDVCNSAAYFVAVDAQRTTPFVTIDRIDSELAAKVAPVMGVRGKPLKGRKMFSALSNVVVKGKPIPLAALILQKRSGAGVYLAKGWPLFASPFKGISRALGAQKMAYYIDKLIKSRHKSTHYLASGWTDAIEKLRGFVRAHGIGVRGIGGRGLGNAIPAMEGYEPSAMIENNIGGTGQYYGLPPKKGSKKESANRALMTYALPPFQAALDREGDSQMRHALAKMDAAIAREINPMLS